MVSHVVIHRQRGDQRLGVQGNEALQLYAGGYDDMINGRIGDLLLSQYRKATKAVTDKTGKNVSRVKLSYKEERELERLPEEIEELEGTEFAP